MILRLNKEELLQAYFCISREFNLICYDLSGDRPLKKGLLLTRRNLKEHGLNKSILIKIATELGEKKKRETEEWCERVESAQSLVFEGDEIGVRLKNGEIKWLK